MLKDSPGSLTTADTATSTGMRSTRDFDKYILARYSGFDSGSVALRIGDWTGL